MMMSKLNFSTSVMMGLVNMSGGSDMVVTGKKFLTGGYVLDDVLDNDPFSDSDDSTDSVSSTDLSNGIGSDSVLSSRSATRSRSSSSPSVGGDVPNTFKFEAEGEDKLEQHREEAVKAHKLVEQKVEGSGIEIERGDNSAGPHVPALSNGDKLREEFGAVEQVEIKAVKNSKRKRNHHQIYLNNVLVPYADIVVDDLKKGNFNQVIDQVNMHFHSKGVDSEIFAITDCRSIGNNTHRLQAKLYKGNNYAHQEDDLPDLTEEMKNLIEGASPLPKGTGEVIRAAFKIESEEQGPLFVKLLDLNGPEQEKWRFRWLARKLGFKTLSQDPSLAFPVAAGRVVYNNKLHDAIVMPFVEGESFYSRIVSLIESSDAESFENLMKAYARALARFSYKFHGLSHGDLHMQNAFINESNEVVFIDLATFAAALGQGQGPRTAPDILRFKGQMNLLKRAIDEMKDVKHAKDVLRVFEQPKQFLACKGFLFSAEDTARCAQKGAPTFRQFEAKIVPEDYLKVHADEMEKLELKTLKEPTQGFLSGRYVRLI